MNYNFTFRHFQLIYTTHSIDAVNTSAVICFQHCNSSIRFKLHQNMISPKESSRRRSTLSHYNFLKIHMLSSLLILIQFLCHTRQHVMASMKNSKTEHNMQCEKMSLRERVEKGWETVMLAR